VLARYGERSDLDFLRNARFARYLDGLGDQGADRRSSA
jgi:hypothetical protein